LEETTMQPPEPASPRRPGSRLLYLTAPLLRSLLYLVAFLLFQTPVLLLLGSLPYLIGGPFFQRGGFGVSEEFTLVAVVLTIPPVILMTWLFVRFIDRRTFASLGVRWPDGGRSAALRQLAAASLGALAVLGVWVAAVLALPDTLAAIRFAGVSPEFAQGPSWWPLPPVLLLLLLLPGFLLAAGLEEWVMRGYVYRALRERWPAWIAALVSSLFFSLLHAWNPSISLLALLNILLAGMVLTALVERTGSLWSATFAHGVWNFAIACLLSVPLSGVPMFHLLKVSIAGDPRMTGDGFGPEGSLALTVIGLLLTAFLWRGMWRRPADRPWTTVPTPAPSAPEDAPRAIST
jgi:membrane protease YdiL (CAAX protease family)